MAKKTRRTRGMAAVALAGALITLAACGSSDSGEGASAGDEPNDLAFATLDQGSAWYNYGVSIGQVLEGELGGGSVVEVLPYSGSIGNPELVTTGEADIATTFSAVAAWAYNGQEGTPFADAPYEDLRVLVGGIDQYYFGPIAPADAPFDSLAEVVDQKMDVDLVSQPRGSLGDVGTNMVLNAYGASVDDIKEWGGSFEPTSTDVATNAIKDGSADLWIQAITAGHPGITELAQTSDIKILPVSDEAVAELTDLGLNAATLPADTFKGQDEDVPLVGFNTAIVASADLDEETAYEVTRAIVEHADELKEANAGMSSFDPANAASEGMTGGVPLHPGAERYYTEAGLLD